MNKYKVFVYTVETKEGSVYIKATGFDIKQNRLLSFENINLQKGMQIVSVFNSDSWLNFTIGEEVKE